MVIAFLRVEDVLPTYVIVMYVFIFAILFFCIWVMFIVEKFVDTIIKSYIWISISIKYVFQ